MTIIFDTRAGKLCRSRPVFYNLKSFNIKLAKSADQGSIILTIGSQILQIRLLQDVDPKYTYNALYDLFAAALEVICKIGRERIQTYYSS